MLSVIWLEPDFLRNQKRWLHAPIKKAVISRQIKIKFRLNFPFINNKSMCIVHFFVVINKIALQIVKPMLKNNLLQVGKN